MPKIENKVLTEPVYVYVKPENETFLVKEAKSHEVSKSFYMDHLLDDVRKGRYKPRIVKPLGIVAKAKLERERRERDNARRRAKRASANANA